MVTQHPACHARRAGSAGQQLREYEHAHLGQCVVGLQFDDHDDHHPACIEQCISVADAADPERVAADTLLQRQRHNECDHDFDFELLLKWCIELRLDHLGIGIRLLWPAGRIWWRAIGTGDRHRFWRLGSEPLALAARTDGGIVKWLRVYPKSSRCRKS